MIEQSKVALETGRGRNQTELEWVDTHRCPKCGGQLCYNEERGGDYKIAWADCPTCRWQTDL